ncbi:hypothetical protein SAMN02745133_01921 [Desulforamulus putei DSM 12395]|uniref:Uncharacterized protein n=1 Tax=Desulforamulus putei DSM 12395 TaxID=1121429 RepID=A0A1M4Z647_9FIRM|nr:hypothetical protein SAMN02745133_01921 [Desulforamulus putei DSM 12395]
MLSLLEKQAAALRKAGDSPEKNLHYLSGQLMIATIINLVPKMDMGFS